MNLFNKLLTVAVLWLATTAGAQVPSVCTGTMFNPITDTDWNNVFPMTIAGVRFSTNSNTVAPLMAMMPPVCTCPTVIFGMPMIGVGVTYWQPLYISEIERRPGCLSSMGGMMVLPGYSMLASEQTVNNNAKSKEVNRMQVHWFEYPLFTLMKVFNSISCKNTAGFNLAYMTEVDPLWQDDLWGAVFTPESAVFANPIAAAACAVDAVASNLDFPLDALFWCAGSWGSIYPLAGNSSHSGDPFTMNNQIQAKYIARSHRMGFLWQTIGPTAICFSHPNPVWIKSQYRYNQVAPVNRRGRAVVTGSSGKLFQFPPITNLPTKEHTINLIWQGQQCCLKPIP